jgi:hypothetical protein
MAKNKKKDKSTVTPYGTHTFKKTKTRAGGSFMRVGGRRRVRKERLTAGTFPVVTTSVEDRGQ